MNKLQELQQSSEKQLQSEAVELNNMVKSSANPQMVINKLIQTNPRLKWAWDLVQQNGGNGKQVFYNLAQRKGIDPDAVLQKLR